MEDTRAAHAITPRSSDFPQWYQEVIEAADLAEHSGIKGSMIIKPYGYALWEQMQAVLDSAIKATGHKNAYFPLLIPEHYLKKEKEHVEGFSPELAVVTHAGGEKLEEPLVVRPTSETIINAAFSRWVQSWRDLPLLINQWANVVRWELRPRLFLRTTEFLWQEGHTAHATQEEADGEARKMLAVYHSFAEEFLAMPVISGQKSESEKFAGAVRSYTIEAMMQDGKALQAGTSHFLGQNFAQAFDVMFTDQSGVRQHVWQTSWGVSTRLIGGLIMTHSDDKGLILPPRIAPVQVVIVPIGREGEEWNTSLIQAQKLAETLSVGLRVEVDNRDYVTPGYKFNEWEKKGVPLRLELGPRDIATEQVVVVRRDTGQKQPLAWEGLGAVLHQVLEAMQSDLLDRARSFRDEHTYDTDDLTQFEHYLEQGGFIRSHWCGDVACERAVNEKTKATIRCLPFSVPLSSGSCLQCGQPAEQVVVWGKAY